MELPRNTATFAAELSYDDIPARIHRKTKDQILSVLGASHAGRHSEGAVSALEAARSWGSPGADGGATAWLSGEKLPVHNAIFANACASVSFDFDDYVFAGHTGHSAVTAAFGYGELHGASGKDVLAAITVGNEVGGRLGASLLFGPQNGQMWSYIHVLEASCIVSRFHGLDASRTANAIGIAFTQPPYALMPAFMGPDSKLLIPSSTTVDGCRAADLAARGWTGNTSIIEDKQGFLEKFNTNNMGWFLSGYGDAWLSDTMTIKVVPGCAYVDTAIDAFRSIQADANLQLDEIERIDVRCGLFTTGMEAFSHMYRSADRLEPITINFSVALSIGLILVAGGLEPEYLSHKYLDANREAIEAAAKKVSMNHDADMDARAGKASESKGFSLGSVLGRKSLEGVSFEDYVMSFASAVTVTTTDGRTLEASQDVPLGAAGRPVDETAELVREKFLRNFSGDSKRATDALEAIEGLESITDVREIAPLLAAD